MSLWHELLSMHLFMLEMLQSGATAAQITETYRQYKADRNEFEDFSSGGAATASPG
jgi:hypothetical protein